MLQNKINIFDNISISQANIYDFEKILPLLKSVNPKKNISISEWKNIFLNPWARNENYCGWKIIYNNEIIGFMGLVFSYREMGGKIYKFANRSSTIIKENYRGFGLGRLLVSKSELLVSDGYVVTTFSGTKTMIDLSKKLGFIDYETNVTFILPLPFMWGILNGLKFTGKISKTKHLMNSRDINIYNDHNRYKCKIIIFYKSNRYCMIVFTKVKKNHLFLGRIHYVSDWNFFDKHKISINNICCLKYGILSLFFSSRPDIKSFFPLTLNYKLTSPRVYKSMVPIDKYDIDTLYSELILLNL